MFSQVAVIAVLLVLVVTGSACPLMGDPSCSPVDDLTVQNALQQSNVKVRLAVSATLGDLSTMQADSDGSMTLFHFIVRTATPMVLMYVAAI